MLCCDKVSDWVYDGMCVCVCVCVCVCDGMCVYDGVMGCVCMMVCVCVYAEGGTTLTLMLTKG